MDKAWQELLGIAEVNKQEWQRLVVDNRELHADLRTLRVRYGFPLPNLSAVVRWLDNTSPQVQCQLNREIDDLAVKHGIPPKWRSPVWYLAILGRPIGLSYSMGFPSGRCMRDESGHLRHEIIIDSETAVGNPHVQEFMESIQRQFLEGPPMPQPMKSNPRKLDWQPVWEWHRKHPDTSLKEIAEMLGYSYGYIRQKLAGFDG